jgi:hypothetical protein
MDRFVGFVLIGVSAAGFGTLAILLLARGELRRG